MTSYKSFGKVPEGTTQQPTPFELKIEEQKLKDFKDLLRLSPVAKETYETLRDGEEHGGFGVSRGWIEKTKRVWEEEYDWRKEEKHINSFPNFKSNITDDNGDVYNVHFVALFSHKPDAIPIAFFHGWPGSFLEFLPMMDILRTKYTPATLPYHIIVPSLIGFTLSSGPPLNRDWITGDTSRIMHKLLLSLGFGRTGYLAQGGDLGAFVARDLAATYPECKGMHINLMYSTGMSSKYENASLPVTPEEEHGIHRMKDFITTQFSYAYEHGTKPSTISLVLASSPLAHLAWIGEKFLAWSGPSTTPDLNSILTAVTLYWLTDCFPSTIYAYRELMETKFVEKPVGYSYFPYEVAPVPRSWAEQTGNLVWFGKHENGGHFAAVEKPEALWRDVEEFVKVAWK
ncbi:hypothetical protein NX059_010181 [Plenodomus lindquistii]|nr:hypothetical protein NX059_010181 [Plenodomus lindquistii]